MNDIIDILLDRVKDKLKEIESKLAGRLDPQQIHELSKQHAKLTKILNLGESLKSLEGELEFWRGMLQEGEDVETEIERVEQEMVKTRRELLSLFISDEYSGGVVMEIRAAAGGEEAALFAADLFRMYTRYAERKGFELEVADFNKTDLGGYKEIVFFVKGKDAHKFLKYESGVHRVQRIPRTESGGRIHTSTATVAVLPEMREIDVKIDPKDIRIDTFRASGHGGQYVNKTESAVRVTHIPTGIVVSIQTERSQHQNKEMALRILRARLYQLHMNEVKSSIDGMRRRQIGSGERSEKVRTYNFPQNRVTDHRINYTTYRLAEVLDGDLDEIVEKLQEAEIRDRIMRGDVF